MFAQQKLVWSTAVVLAATLEAGSLALAKKPPPEPEPSPPPPFTYDVTWIGVPDGHRESYVYGMNDLGDLVGISYLDPEHTTHCPFVSYTAADGSRETVDLNSLIDPEQVFPFPTGYELSRAHDINNKRQVTGLARHPDPNIEDTARAFRFDLDTRLLENLGTVAGKQTSGKCINDAGDVAGLWDDNGTLRAFFYSDRDGSTGGITDLGDLGGSAVWPEAINSSGQVTGYIYGSPYFSVCGFIYTRDVGMSPLVKADGSVLTVLTSPYGINDDGMIVGRGRIAYQINRQKTEVVNTAMLCDYFETDKIEAFASPPDCTTNTLFDINCRGEIVGQGSEYKRGSFIKDVTYISIKDDETGVYQLYGLNELAGEALGLDGMYAPPYYRIYINELSQISGTSLRTGLAEPVLLTPVYPVR